ncbi:MAG: hypothetical protein H6807_14185 [Planctomycetes bacterium]|nr:hypothetical protein [Planctomycetota bacterium]
MFRLALVLVIGLAAGLDLVAQVDVPPVAIASAKVLPTPVAPGGEARIEVTVAIEPGWHIYSVAEHEGQESTSFALKTEGVTLAGAIVEPEPHVDRQDWGTYYEHSGQVVFSLPVRFAAELKGDLRIRGEMAYMACDDSGCLPPAKLGFSARASIAPPTGPQEEPKTALDLAALKKLVAEVVSGANESLQVDLERVLDRLERLEEAVIPEPQFAPEPPAWDLVLDDFSILDRNSRAGETVRARLRFVTGEKVKLDKPGEIYVDVGSSKRFVEAEAVAATSDAEGLHHEVEIELLARDLARSGTEDLDLTVSLPMNVEGLVFEKEIGGLKGRVEFGLPSMGAWILKAVIAALLALLTPCVFPMIPITVSVFTKQAEKQHRNPLVMPLVYVFGIVASFVAIGTAFTFAFGAAGAQVLATNGWLQGAFGVLFVVFSLSLFGLFNLRPPAFLMNKAGQAQGRGDLAGILLMGLLFSMTSFTCTAPLVGLILVDAAESGEWQFPIVGMLAFSLVLAIPFFFLALFPRLLTSMPRSGGWMNRVKATLGFLELAFALKFIGAMDAYFGWAVFTRTSILWLWVIIFMMNGAYLLGFVNFKHDMKPEKIGGIAGSVAVAMIILGLHTMQGAYGKSMPYVMESLLPPSLEEGGDGGVLGWHNHVVDDPDLAIARAKSAGTGILVDFTGYT